MVRLHTNGQGPGNDSFRKNGMTVTRLGSGLLSDHFAALAWLASQISRTGNPGNRKQPASRRLAAQDAGMIFGLLAIQIDRPSISSACGGRLIC